MAKDVRPHPKAARQPHFFRQWREHRGWSLASVVDRLSLVEPPYEISEAQLSRIERGDQGYNQDLLEALAKVFSTEAASLIMRNPEDPDGIWSIWDNLTPVERQQGLAVLKAIRLPRPVDTPRQRGVGESATPLRGPRRPKK